MLFRDRGQAGRLLAKQLRDEQDSGGLPRPVVLALPRGGLPVAAEIARALGAPLDVLVAHKIPAPWQREFALGALADDEPPVFDRTTLRRLGLSEADLVTAVERTRAEVLRREKLYRGDRPAVELADRSVVVVDDGLATGSTARAALRSARTRHPGRLVLAVPVAAPSAARDLAEEADEVVCLHQPRSFQAVGTWYDDFGQLDDDDVLAALDSV
jgi:putative phosphoribosyl transferase